MGLKRTVPPATGALSLNDAKKACEISTSDTAHDTHLVRLIDAAVADVERHTRRALITQTWQLTLGAFPACEIRLPRPPLVSVTSVGYIDENGASQTFSSSNYDVATGDSPGFLRPGYNQVWPATRPSRADAVTVTYVAGYGSSPVNIPIEYQQLIAELVVFRFEPGRGDLPVDIPKHIRWSLDSLKCGMAMGSYGVRQ